jgi:hypothetical protein
MISYKPLGLDKVENGHDLRKNIPDTNSKVKLPTLAEVKNAIAEHKAKVKTGEKSKRTKPVYDLAENIRVSAEYLMWALEATGAEYAEYNSGKITPANDEHEEYLYGALTVKSEDAIIIMMPISKKR